MITKQRAMEVIRMFDDITNQPNFVGTRQTHAAITGGLRDLVEFVQQVPNEAEPRVLEAPKE